MEYAPVVGNKCWNVIIVVFIQFQMFVKEIYIKCTK